MHSLYRYVLLIMGILLLVGLPACQRKSLVEDVTVESVLISEFKMSDKEIPELAQTLFSIDHRKGLIYNAHPLPRGTKIGLVEMHISSSPDALPKIYIAGVEHSSTSGLDTIDMSRYAEGVRIVMQHRNNATLTKEYQLQINIYDRDFYSHIWTQSAHTAPLSASRNDIDLSRLVDNGVAYYYFTRSGSERHLWRATHTEPELWEEVTIPSTLDSPIIDIAEQGGSDAIMGLQESGQFALYEHSQDGGWTQSNSLPNRSSHLLGNLYHRGENNLLTTISTSEGIRFSATGGLGVLAPRSFPLEDNARLSLFIEHHPIALIIGGSIADTTTFVYSTSNGLDWLTPHDAGLESQIWPSALPGSAIYEPQDETILFLKPASRPNQVEQPAMRVYRSLDYGTVWQQLTETSILPSIYYDKAQTHQRGLALYRGDDSRLYLFGGLKDGEPILWVGQPTRFQ